jgi:hypothetical protein
MAASKPVRAMTHDRLKVFSGNANRALSEEICEALNIDLGKAMVRVFADGETYLQIQENVRGADVFVIQPTCTPVDHNLMELLLMDALKRASAERITRLTYYALLRPRASACPSPQTGSGAVKPRGRPDSGARSARGADSGFRHSVDHLASPVMIVISALAWPM